MAYVERNDSLDHVFLVIIKHLKVKAPKQIEIDLIAIISDAHYTRTLFVEQPDLLFEILRLEVFERNHLPKIRKPQAR